MGRIVAHLRWSECERRRSTCRHAISASCATDLRPACAALTAVEASPSPRKPEHPRPPARKHARTHAPTTMQQTAEAAGLSASCSVEACCAERVLARGVRFVGCTHRRALLRASFGQVQYRVGVRLRAALLNGKGPRSAVDG